MSWLGEIWGFNQAWLDYFSLQVESWQGSNFHRLNTFTHTGKLPTVDNTEHQGAAVSTVWGPLTSDPNRLLEKRTKPVGCPSHFACSCDWRVQSGGWIKGESRERRQRRQPKAVRKQEGNRRRLQIPTDVSRLENTVLYEGSKPTLVTQQTVNHYTVQ